MSNICVYFCRGLFVYLLVLNGGIDGVESALDTADGEENLDFFNGKCYVPVIQLS